MKAWNSELVSSFWSPNEYKQIKKKLLASLLLWFLTIIIACLFAILYFFEIRLVIINGLTIFDILQLKSSAVEVILLSCVFYIVFFWTFVSHITLFLATCKNHLAKKILNNDTKYVLHTLSCFFWFWNGFLILYYFLAVDKFYQQHQENQKAPSSRVFKQSKPTRKIHNEARKSVETLEQQSLIKNANRKPLSLDEIDIRDSDSWNQDSTQKLQQDYPELISIDDLNSVLAGINKSEKKLDAITQSSDLFSETKAQQTEQMKSLINLKREIFNLALKIRQLHEKEILKLKEIRKESKVLSTSEKFKEQADLIPPVTLTKQLASTSKPPQKTSGILQHQDPNQIDLMNRQEVKPNSNIGDVDGDLHQIQVPLQNAVQEQKAGSTSDENQDPDNTFQKPQAVSPNPVLSHPSASDLGDGFLKKSSSLVSREHIGASKNECLICASNHVRTAHTPSKEPHNDSHRTEPIPHCDCNQLQAPSKQCDIEREQCACDHLHQQTGSFVPENQHGYCPTQVAKTQTQIPPFERQPHSCLSNDQICCDDKYKQKYQLLIARLQGILQPEHSSNKNWIATTYDQHPISKSNLNINDVCNHNKPIQKHQLTPSPKHNNDKESTARFFHKPGMSQPVRVALARLSWKELVQVASNLKVATSFKKKESIIDEIIQKSS